MNKYVCVFILIILFLSITIPLPIAAQKLQPSPECMDCHRSNYAEWIKSAHAHSSAWTNPLYRGMLEWAERSGGKKLSASCQTCHEPARMFQSEGNVPMTVIQEGVGCDFCHTVQLKNSRSKFKKGKDGTKLGPIKDAISSIHECAYSKDHTTSEFCLVCHSTLSTATDLRFCSSQSEWQEFIDIKTRIECQDCHMPSREDRAATLGKMRDNIHSHEFWGGYSEKMLHSAVKLELLAIVQENSVSVQVIATNRGAGHYVPTGSPMRFVVLQLTAKNADEIIWQNWYTNPIEEDPAAVFMRLLENEEGQGPVPPWEAVWERFDQRLRPEEPRKLVYSIPELDVTLVEAKLVYRVAPPALLNKLGISESRYTEPRIMTSEVAVPHKRDEQRQ
jgi:hypothetical protein